MQTDWKCSFSENIRNYEALDLGKALRPLSDPEIISLAGGLAGDVPEGRRGDFQRGPRKPHRRHHEHSPIPGEPRLIEAVIRVPGKGRHSGGRKPGARHLLGRAGADLTGRLLLDPGDPVLVDRPTLPGALVAFRMQRPRFAGVELEADGRASRMSRQIRDCAGESRKPKFIYVVPDFQNPSGITMSVEKRRALLQISEQSGIPIVEDSPDRSLRYRGAQCPSLFSLDQQQGGEHVIGVYTFSKLFCRNAGRVQHRPGCSDRKDAGHQEGAPSTPPSTTRICAPLFCWTWTGRPTWRSAGATIAGNSRCSSVAGKEFPGGSAGSMDAPQGGVIRLVEPA